MRRLLLSLAITVSVSIPMFSVQITSQQPPASKKAARMLIIKGPALESATANSSAGPLMISMRAAFLLAGGCWEVIWTENIGMLTETVIASDRSSLLIYNPLGVSSDR